VRYSQQCSWWFRSSCVWPWVSDRSGPDVSRESGVLICKVRSFETCWRNVGRPRKIQTNWQQSRQSHPGMAHTLLLLLMMIMKYTNLNKALSITEAFTQNWVFGFIVRPYFPVPFRYMYINFHSWKSYVCWTVHFMFRLESVAHLSNSWTGNTYKYQNHLQRRLRNE
jgi:hypothetical protein